MTKTLDISPKANVAINLAKAFHILAVCSGDKDMIDNANEHLEVALDYSLDSKVKCELDATKHAIIAAMQMLIDSVE